MLTSKNGLPAFLELPRGREVEKLRKLAAACGEEFDQNFLVNALKNLLKVVPNSIRESHYVREAIRSLIHVATARRRDIHDEADSTRP